MNKNLKDKAVVISFTLAILIFFALCLFMPKAKFSESERRPLAQFPKISAERILKGKFMSEFEKYSLDSFPFRDNFRTLKALTAGNVFLKQDNNGIYEFNGFLSKVEYPLKDEAVKRAAERFKYVTDKYLKEGNSAYLSIIPDKNYFMAKESKHLSMDYERLVSTMLENTDFLTYIDIFPTLTLDDYYFTDTHWRQEKLIPTAEKLAEGLGVEISSDYEEKTLTEDFGGVYKGQSALPIKGESLKYLVNDTLKNAYVFDYQNDKETEVYNLEKGSGKDPYEVFLSGPVSLIEMKNENTKTDKELVIFRDSFGSSISPLLLEGYSKVTLADIRYMSPDMFGKYIDFENADILFLYSTMVINNSETLK